MKESGEKGGTEDINIGVGELQEAGEGGQQAAGEHFVADSFSFGVEREMKESGEKGGTEDINIGVGELQEAGEGGQQAAGEYFVADSFSFGVEREMKESGEKGGTEDINIGVGELQEVTISKSMDAEPEGTGEPAGLNFMKESPDPEGANGGNVEFEWKIEEGESSGPQPHLVAESAPGAPGGQHDTHELEEVPLTYQRIEVTPTGDEAPGGLATQGGDTGVPAVQDTGPASGDAGLNFMKESPESAEGAKGGNVEFEWKVEEGESAPDEPGLVGQTGGGQPAGFMYFKDSPIVGEDDDGPAVLFEQKVMDEGGLSRLGSTSAVVPDAPDLDDFVEDMPDL